MDTTVHIQHFGNPENPCEHMQALVGERGYVKDELTGLWLVEMCLAPSTGMPGEVCGKIVPAGMHCLTCSEHRVGPAPDHLVYLHHCHWRCKKCKRITVGCNVQACGYCHAQRSQKLLTLLPLVVNPDWYGFNVVNG